MQVYQDEAFVLKSIPLKEADKILILLSSSRGKYKAIAYGIDKPKSKKRGFLQPFTYTKVLVRESKDWKVIEQSEGVNFFPKIKESVEGFFLASYFCELVDAVVQDDEVSPLILDLLMEALDFFGRGENYLLARSFELKLLDLAGFAPYLDNCLVCKTSVKKEKYFLNPALGGILCSDCQNKHELAFPLGGASFAIMKLLQKWSFEKLLRLKVDLISQKEIKQALLGFWQYYLDFPLKSSRFLD